MAKVHWKIFSGSSAILQWLWLIYSRIKLMFLSLFYNDFADRYYIGETLMEPLFWFVDHFTKVLGPICVFAVIVLTSSIILIGYIIGLPFYMEQNAFIFGIALIIGHWLLINVTFYYFKAYTTDPGYPPQGAMIAEAVSICKKCIAPKPPRTHHCIVCNCCILKMDHHCPWLNNCIGHFNHRYFFMFCAYSWISVVFLIIFGIPLAYEHVFGDATFSRISPVIVNLVDTMSQHIPFTSMKNKHNILKTVVLTNVTEDNKWPETAYHSCIVYAALLCVAVLLVLGGLLVWHALLISNGETSIEGHINKKERERLRKNGQVYKNPFDFGQKTNWKIFLCVGFHRPWWHIFLPFTEDPIGNGIQWNLKDNGEWDYENAKKDYLKSCLIKFS